MSLRNPLTLLRDGLNQSPRSTYKSKCSFGMLGTPGSGKSTVAGLLYMTATTMSAYLQGDFKCDVIESNSGVLESQTRLRMGRFPPKTDPNSPIPYESGLLMQWPTRFRKKEMHIPLCDVAGETVEDLVTKYRKGVYDLSETTLRDTRFLVNELKERDGYILTATAPWAPMFEGGKSFEKESSKLTEYADVNLARILEADISYKRQFPKIHPIQSIMVVVTKYDLVKSVCENMGMDLYDESGNGFRNFMNTCFPNTANKLRFFGLENVKFYPSEVGIHEDKTWPLTAEEKAKGLKEGPPRIKVKRRRPDGTPCMVPEYPEQTYVQIINDLKEIAT